MSQGRFVFSPSALRSLERDKELLEREQSQRRLAAPAVTSYFLRKEVREKSIAWSHGSPQRPALICKDLVVQNALYTGDLEALRQLFPKGAPVNLVIQPEGGDMIWVNKGGLWSLAYEQELTTPLHITAGRGFTECLRLLLLRGANVDLAPGGTTALHEACEECQGECAKLLLSYGANANAVNEDGLMPLHVCTELESIECAKHLLQFGAAVNGRSLEEDDSPLHVACRHGLPDHVSLYLRYGAHLEHHNDEGKSPLNAACSQPQEKATLGRYYQVCQQLVEAGAKVGTEDLQHQTPLHMSCKNVNPDVVDLMLKNGAHVNDMCYGGNAPMHNVLKEVAYKPEHEPERVVQALLNYGSIRVWPGALPQVLKYCCTSPRVIEVLLNAYDRLKITEAWVEAVPPEVFKQHQGFYESVFALTQTPRSLQHLARFKLRNYLEGRLTKVVPKLDLPNFLKKYLLLDFRDYVH
ncbi:ankyrin repeat and SOCS box protein 10 isoform X1 [Alosa sapidissima]|uniref:ankyrin repeat and SOCS box protein 10 isoform X1 n=1 Tax=Alosa sapidissima TaxID=34773 RepID=UPI001C09D2A9|nr:ankyrin repeat and SOCS box protein 10 isoform X1 [Alosa sapidissima]